MYKTQLQAEHVGAKANKKVINKTSKLLFFF
jgi:hypothetical protein